MEKVIYMVAFIIEALVAWQYFSGMYESKYAKLSEGISIGIAYLLLFIISLKSIFVLNLAGFLLMNFLLLCFLFNGNWLNKLFQAMVLTALMGFAEVFAGTAMSLWTPEHSDIVNDSFSLTIFGLVSKPIYYLFTRIIIYFFGKRRINYKTTARETFAVFFSGIVTLIILFGETRICFFTDLNSGQRNIIAVNAILLIFLDLVIFWVYQYMQERNLEFTNLQLQLQKDMDRLSYYENLRQHDENQRILIHDMKNHLQAIMAMNLNGEQKRINEYIEHLINSKELQTAMHLCDHELLNVILNRYTKLCGEKNIKFNVDIRSNRIDKMAENDITSLFANILDNAVEAAEKGDNGFIEISISNHEENGSTIISVLNSCTSKPKMRSDGTYVSLKTDSGNHGMGMKSIQKVLRKYNGTMASYYDAESGQFKIVIGCMSNLE